MRLSKVFAALVVSALSLSSVACGGDKQVDYSTVATKPTELTIDEIAVVASVPDGFKPSAASSDNLRIWEAPAGMFAGPEITISSGLSTPKSVEEAVKEASPSEAPTRKEKVGEAFIVSSESASGASYTVDTYVPATDESTLHCHVSYLRASGKIENIAKQRAWAETLCLGVKPKVAPVKIAVIPEMTDFLGQFGTGVSIGKALTKYGTKGLATRDMELYDIKSPAITRTKKEGALTCYAFSGKSGLTTRSYNVCWEGKQIKRVDDLGMR